MNKDINCKHCNRFLFEQAGTVVIEKMTCPSCKAKMNFKLINANTAKDYTHKFVNPEQPPKKTKEVEVS
jgi:phage FluMu protein Com